MEVITPVMEMATSYIATPYGVAAIAGVILISVLLLVFSTQKEITYDDFNKHHAQLPQAPVKPAPQPKKQKKAYKRKSKKTKEVSEPEEDEAQYDIVTTEEVPATDDIPAAVTEPQEEQLLEPAEEFIEEAMEPIEEVIQPITIEIESFGIADVEEVVVTRSHAKPVLEKPEKKVNLKVKKAKKKISVVEGGNEGIFQIVDQAQLSEDDIETLLCILKSKEGDDNWLSAGRPSEETKDGLRKKVAVSEALIKELHHDVELLKEEMIHTGDDKIRLTVEIRSMEKKLVKERETLNGQIIQLKNHSQARQDEVTRLKKEIEDRDRINNTLNIQLSQHRNNPSITQQCVDLKNRVVELEEELQESREQYNDLERNIAQINTMEKKLLDKDDTISQQKEQLHQLEQQLKCTASSDNALADAQTQAQSLRAQLEKLQEYVSTFETTKSELELVRVENDTMRSELAVHKDKGLPDKLAAAALEQSTKEKTPSESSMSSTVDISAEIAEQLQVAESQLTSVKKEQEDLKCELSAVQSERADLTTQIAALTAQVEDAKLESAKSESDSDQIVALKSELATVTSEAEAAKSALEAGSDDADEKLQLAVSDRDRAIAETQRYQDVLSKTEGILSQLQTKFEDDIHKWGRDLEDKRLDLDLERSKVSELEEKLSAEQNSKQKLLEFEQDLSDLQTKLSATEGQLDSEKRWHSDTLIKLKEAETNASTTSTVDIESLQKTNEVEQKWHAQTLTQLQQANGDVTLLQEKLANKNMEISQLTNRNKDLAQKVEDSASGNDTLQDEVNDLKEKADDNQISEANQPADKKFTSI